MTIDDEANMFLMSDGCPSHGDEYIKECATCGNEFCARCYPNSIVCPDCSEEAAAEDDLDEDFDNEELKGLKDFDHLLDDDEVERILNESNEIPPEDLVDKEVEEDRRR